MAQKEIYKSEYEVIYFDEERREAMQIWFETTKNIKDDMVKQEQLKMAELFEQYKPLYHLADARDFIYPVSPELQHWISTEIATRVKDAGIKKSAMVYSKEFIAQLSIKQLGDEIAKDISTRDKDVSEDEEYDVQVFASVADARKWFYGG